MNEFAHKKKYNYLNILLKNKFIFCKLFLKVKNNIKNMNKSIVKNAFSDAYNKIKTSNIVNKTILEKNYRLSKEYDCNVYFKREDLQSVRSFKIRGAYNKISKFISKSSMVTASAGNHAQGVSLTCNSLGKKHHVFLPINTPKQKINKIKHFGGNNLNLHIIGNNFDESLYHSKLFSRKYNSTFIHPFDDPDVIIGQGTVAMEIYEEIKPDAIICPVGGGGLISGCGLFSKYINKECKIFGVEPENADSLNQSLLNNNITPIDKLDTFVDGASVRTTGKYTFEACKKFVDEMFIISNNMLSFDMIEIYQNEGIILEPAGTLSISCLRQLDRNKIKGKNIVCILSGGNNDVSRYPEILEKSLLYKNLKHYFLVSFVQKPGELRNFINNIVGKNDDITRFEYLKKNNKNFGVVLIGIELQNENNLQSILDRLDNSDLEFTKITEKDLIHQYII